MANDWKQIYKDEGDYLRPAFCLLQETLSGYDHLSLDDLRGKMNRLDTHPSTPTFGLRVFSYADLADLENFKRPLVSAFFFLRRIHIPQGSKPWAYCLTFGARPEGGASGGLARGPLRTALGTVCERMRVEPHSKPLEVMHEGSKPNFRDPNSNASQFFDDVTASGANPPKLEALGTIDLEFPWAPENQTLTLTRWNIKEKN